MKTQPIQSPRRWTVLLRVLAVPAFALLGAWFLHLAAFHSWSSWGPPTSSPEWHKLWSMRFLLLSAASILVSLSVLFGPMIFRKLRRN
jgi:hypothetical protein